MDKEIDKEQVLRISLGWLLTGSAAIIALGFIGGLISVQVWSPQITPLTSEREQLVSTIQEVTISPNTTAAQVVSEAERSVVAIVRDDGQGKSVVATGVVVTNDGLVVTTDKLPAGPLSAYDYKGVKLPLDLVGVDALFGLSYGRLRDAVLSPIDLRTEQTAVAFELMAISRNAQTFLPRAEFYRINEHILPPELMPPGIQLMFRGTAMRDAYLAGSPLVDEEGHLAGLLVNPAAGLALPARQLHESLQRVTSGRREFDPFTGLGLQVHYDFAPVGEQGERSFVVEVLAVSANSAAEQAGMKRGDIITSINDEQLDWQRSLISQLAQDLPLQIAVQRADTRVSITISDQIP